MADTRGLEDRAHVFLSELTELSRRYGIAISGESALFVMEWEDLRSSYSSDTESKLSFGRSEEHTSELQSLMRISYDVFCLQKHTNNDRHCTHIINNHENPLNINCDV